MTDAELAVFVTELKQIEEQLYQFAYGKDESGERYIGHEDLGKARAFIECAIKESERLLTPNPE